MARITTYNAFKQALDSLSLAEQRQIGAKFIEEVLSLVQAQEIRNIIHLIGKEGTNAEMLSTAYRVAHTFYIQTHPRSDLGELNFSLQAAHFVAEACMSCLSPLFPESQQHHLAQKVAMYCRMAKTCSTMKHDEDTPNLAEMGAALESLVKRQYQILDEFIDKR